MVQLSPTALNLINEGAQEDKLVTLFLERVPLEQLYARQKEIQQEIQFQEEIVHDELQMMEVDRVHYIDLCATCKRENEEITKEAARLKTTVKEVMTVVTYVEYEEEKPL